jgi:hypothetical protein
VRSGTRTVPAAGSTNRRHVVWEGAARGAPVDAYPRGALPRALLSCGQRGPTTASSVRRQETIRRWRQTDAVSEREQQQHPYRSDDALSLVAERMFRGDLLPSIKALPTWIHFGQAGDYAWRCPSSAVSGTRVPIADAAAPVFGKVPRAQTHPEALGILRVRPTLKPGKWFREVDPQRHGPHRDRAKFLL